MSPTISSEIDRLRLTIQEARINHQFWKIQAKYRTNKPGRDHARAKQAAWHQTLTTQEHKLNSYLIATA
jgi:hypothetical protein